MSTSKRSTISVYGCGGLGTNIVQDYTNLPADKDDIPMFAVPALHIVDTSASNVLHLPGISTTVIPGLNGAGKDRIKPFREVLSTLDTLIQSHPPSDVNLVIFSLSGGSGSVVGPLLAQELLKRGNTTIVLGVGSTTSAKEADNTLKTLQSLQNIATKACDRPLSIIYFENGVEAEYGGTRTAINANIENMIRRVGLLFAGNHKEMDKTDLDNLLNYPRVAPDIKQQLVEILSVTDDTGPIDALSGKIIATASLLNYEDDAVPDVGQMYSAVGYYNTHIDDSVELPNMHFALTVARIPTIINRITDKIEEYNAVSKELAATPIHGAVDTDNDSGMVF